MNENEQYILNKIKEFETTFFDDNFKWRPGQKEAIIEILLAYYNKTHNTIILDCPTGGGKSIIGMAVSWVLNQNNKTGYILTSDIALQEQYENDFKRYNFKWGSVKGIDNYICIDNGEKNSLGTCRIRNIIPNKMPCYKECPYFKVRNMAAKTSTSLLNYAYWLIMMNYVYSRNNEESLFHPRDFTICDEAHKIVDIVQNHFSPQFDEKTLEKLEKFVHFFNLYKIKDHSIEFENIKENIKNLWDTENQDKLHSILLDIEHLFENFFSSINTLKNKVQTEYSHEEPPKKWKEALYISDWLKDLHCKIEDFNDIIEKTSTRNLIKNPINNKELRFNCLEESYLMNKYFHQWTGFIVLMSATIADPIKYLKNISLKNAKYIKVNSHFDFTKSPIYFYNQRKMTYDHIEKNLPWLYEKIDEILNKHENERGIIHSVSYDLTLKIYENISEKNRKRILIYSGTEEKKEVLSIFKRDKRKVLMGPSLLEGLDLRDDWSRFQIFAKIPYLSLSDKFVATKLKINPDWYREKAILNILQGTGRSIRNENDWSITYILDGALSDLIHNSRKSFPVEFLNRIIVVK